MTLMKYAAAACVLALLVTANQAADYDKMLKDSKITLVEAIDKALKESKDGVAIQAELEDDGGKFVYSVDVAKGKKNHSMVLDSKSGKVLESDLDDEDFSAIADAAKITLKQAIEAASKGGGKPVFAVLRLDGDKPFADVTLFEDGATTVVVVDALTGKVVDAGAEAEPSEYTDTFGEDDADLGPTGKNPFFILEPGYELVLEGKEGRDEVKIVILVTNETRKFGTVETRVVTETETVDGEVEEITRDYFAISKRTNNVYYFGEDVDVYADGKVVSHEGSWLHGEKGAKYGLIMEATPLLGSRYQQETAPGVGMDRAETVSITEKYECPAGKFENVLKIKETTPLEPGTEFKHYARGVGLLQDGVCKLTKYGKTEK